MANQGKEQFKVYSKNGNAIGKVDNLHIDNLNMNNKTRTSNKWQIIGVVIAALGVLWAVISFFIQQGF